MSIVLTGTTGNLGAEVLQYLIKLIPPSQIIVSVYNPSSDASEALKKTGVDVRRGDYNEPSTLEEAFKGADKLFLVSSPSFSDDVRVSQHTNAINAAKKVGVKHIYYTSLVLADSESHAGIPHTRTEEILKESGITYTIIREAVYAEFYSTFLGFFANDHKEVILPGDGLVGFTSRTNLAEGNALVLVSDDDEFKNQTIYLTNTKTYTLQQTTEILSKILKRDIAFKTVSQEEWLTLHVDKGEIAKFWVSTYPALEKGGASATSPLLEKLLGKPLISFEDRLKELVEDAEKKQ